MVFEFDFDFRVRQPVGDISRVIEQTWYARGTVPYRSELIAPTGSCVVLIVFGDPIRQTPSSGRSYTSDEGMVIGPHVGPIENAPLGETFALGIVTTSVGGEATLGVPPTSLRGRVVALDQVGRQLLRWRSGLGASDLADPDVLLDQLEQHLFPLVDFDIPGIERMEQAVRLLEDEPRRPIAELAEALDVTHAHLDREFSRVVGLSPRALARLLLLRRLLTNLDPLSDLSWAEIAFENGWSDQAHFSRDFKRHTGVSPRRYLATQRVMAAAGAENGAGFTPDLGDLRQPRDMRTEPTHTGSIDVKSVQEGV